MGTSGLAGGAVGEWLARVRFLAEEIGPRGSTTDGERRGHDFVEAELRQCGLAPVREPFAGARSIFLPHLLAALLMLTAFAVYPWGGRMSAAAAAALSILTVVTELQELGFHDNLFRRLVPKAPSQNVYAVVQPSGKVRRDVVLVGHVDTQRTPLVFRSTAWVRVYAAFTLLVFVAFLAQTVLFTLGTVTQWQWVWWASLPSAVSALLLAAMCVEADHSPFTAGANDNASAVGLVLTLAQRYAAHPLGHTRLWAVATGCEEVQHYGMIDFYRRHRSELQDPVAIPFEMVGATGPAYQVLEGIVVPFRADAGLVALCERLSTEHPEWDSYPVKVIGGNTEMADAIRFGVPSIAITGVTRDHVAPYWHQRAETADKMDPSAMARTYAMVTTLIEALDS